jgi:hypothetical protein
MHLCKYANDPFMQLCFYEMHLKVRAYCNCVALVGMIFNCNPCTMFQDCSTILASCLCRMQDASLSTDLSCAKRAFLERAWASSPPPSGRLDNYIPGKDTLYKGIISINNTEVSSLRPSSTFTSLVPELCNRSSSRKFMM